MREPVNKRPLPPEVLALCRAMRHNDTEAEKLFWRLLRNRQLGGAKFRRQHAIGRYILDFYCHEARLAIELDGGQHGESDQARRDERRTRYLQEQGIRVLRFWNHQVRTNSSGILQAVWDALFPANAVTLTPHPNPLPQGEGE
ncbi:MAG TPA: endonuclease domain-containing protein, partial [Candidatus Bathyarchaeia archaeon]|nr:endonuclease domain-containing protein [Candidatus Bathyarchaeia archaeon]